jgi:hypothetical protein
MFIALLGRNYEDVRQIRVFARRRKQIAVTSRRSGCQGVEQS